MITKDIIDEVSENLSVGIVLPKWFVWMFSIVFLISTVTILPWVVWQTRVTMRLEIRLEELYQIKGRVDSFNYISSKLESVNHRLSLVESDISGMDGNRWNKSDYERYVKPNIENNSKRIDQIISELQQLRDRVNN